MTRTSMGLWLGALSLLCVAAALMLWHVASNRARRQATSAFIDHQLERHASQAHGHAHAHVPADAPTPAASGARPRSVIPGWDALLLNAGVFPDMRLYLLLVMPAVCMVVLALGFAGPLSAGLALFLYCVLVYFRLWTMGQKRLRKMAVQLPGFLDSVVRLVTIGSSLGSAFQSAVPSAEEPLKNVLERAAQLNRAGMELDTALRQVAKVYNFPPLYLIASVIGIGLRFGGRSDLVLDRMANFMRDLDQARQELIALSSETRMSAWILGLMPLGVACFIVVFNNDMFMSMWADPSGQNMLLSAVGLQLVGSFWLYRLAKGV
ncbi:type II secretion system F family protein [Pigmentiphaga aceris]|uniref:Type II secretion system F family protein n=1 Tax=Pigmentiphaga aceris TaxID=1940612 RepID=A0A5C0AVB6_9BURK|nr:type II secretion system F family protein [Pigmentiphaga aceris]QEI05646.1 type II secretion system F family protein [Pigmentiphaga aceris]